MHIEYSVTLVGHEPLCNAVLPVSGLALRKRRAVDTTSDTASNTAALPPPFLALLLLPCCPAPLAAMSSAWAEVRSGLEALLQHTSLATPGLAEAHYQFHTLTKGLNLLAVQPTPAERAELTR